MINLVKSLEWVQFSLKNSNGNQWILKEVRHVLDLKKNIISIGKLGGGGCVTTFIDKT